MMHTRFAGRISFLFCAALLHAAHIAGAAVLYVDARATGTGDGSSWENACTSLHGAMGLLSASANEIWVAGPIALSSDTDSAELAISVAATVRGGFAGGETSAEDRAEGARTLYDGEGLRNGLTLKLSQNAATFERFTFANCRGRACNATLGSTTLTFTDCVFRHNGYDATSNLNGLGVYASGGESWGNRTGALVLTDCVIEDNVRANNASTATSCSGAGVYVTGASRATFTRCTFARNGIAAADLSGASKASVSAAAFYSYNTPITAVGCRFIDNRVRGAKSIVQMENGGASSEYRNCVFAGNEEYGAASDDAIGMFRLNLVKGTHNTDSNMNVLLENCTFAYNLSCAKAASAALNLLSCNATVRNCILFGNMIASGSSSGSDIMSHAATGVASFDYSLFGGSGRGFCDGPGLSRGDQNVYADDAKFVTSSSAFLGRVVGAGSGDQALSRAPVGFHFDLPDQVSQPAFDVHVLSPAGYCDNAGVWHQSPGQLSVAVDAGDPATDCTVEPEPNGARVNLGAYGNTTEASKTPAPDQPKVDPNDITVAFVGGYTQPQVSVRVTSDVPDAVFNASVIISVGGEQRAFGGVQDGDTVTWKFSQFFEPDADVTVSVRVAAGDGTEPVVVDKTVKAEGVKPVWAGHGGGAGVIHVNANATGKGDGSSWTDGYTDLREALKYVSVQRHEVWVMTNMFLAAENDGITYAIATAYTVRGGFTGAEDAASERPEGLVSVYDGEGVHPGLSLTLGAAATFERIRFMRCTGCGITATTSVSGQMLTCDGCSFARNGFAATASRNGLGISFKGYESWGVYYGDAALTDCTFEDLTVSNNITAATTCTGAGFYSGGMGALTMTRCRFLRNGISAEDAEGESKAGVNWAALYLKIGSVNAVGCEFRGNRTRGAGGIVGLMKGTHVFRNCVYAGNEECGASSSSAGGFRIDNGKATFVNDTFAYNASCASAASAALNLNGGSTTVTNCIFYGNVAPSSSAGADICSLSSAALGHADWSFFRSVGTDCVSGAGMSLGKNNLVADDPLFVTTTEEFQRRTAADLDRFDVHLLSKEGYVNNAGVWMSAPGKASKAIDAGVPSSAGTPESDCSNEPEPNGGRINLGAYGNTAAASKTPAPDQPKVDPNDITVAFVGGYTQPQVSVRVTSDNPDAVFSVSVKLSVGGEQRVFDSVQNGDVITWKLSRFFEPDADVTVAVTIDAGSGTEPVVVEKTVKAEGVKPVWAGHGGGAGVIHVNANATGAGDGSSWTDGYADLREALKYVNATRHEVWVMTNMFLAAENDGLTVDAGVAYTVRGGFTGAEDAASERPEGAVSVYDGEGVHPGLSLTLRIDPVFERIRFTRCTGSGITASTSMKNRTFTCDGCSFARNGYAATASRNGLGISFKDSLDYGVYYGSVILTDCTFEDLTVSNNVTAATTCTGAGFYSAGLGTLTMARCKFLRNGVSAEDAEGESKAGVNWAALYLGVGNVTAVGCEFRGNRTRGAGGIVGLMKGTHVFRNCVYAGNEEYGASSSSVGGFRIDSGKAAFVNDTFAYNASCASGASAALNLNGGSTTVTNSIFYGNVAPSSSAGADICSLSAAALGHADWSFFRSVGTDCVSGAGMSLGKNNLVADDPQFVTTTEEFQRRTAADLDRFDVHLLSKEGYVNNAGVWLTAPGKASKAIDAGVPASAGTPESDCSNEPEPNGGRINLGAYGNTAAASKTPAPDQPKVDPNDITVAFVGGYTQPQVSVRVTSDVPGAVFNASVTLSVGGVQRVFDSVQNGDTVTWKLSRFFEPNEDVTVAVTVDAGGGTEPVVVDKTVKAEGVKPVWAGHGGGAGVIHVNANATGAGDGSSWTDGYTDLREALKYVNATRHEVWVMTNMFLAAENDGITYAIATAYTVRGGFTGAEDAASERPEGAVSVYDGEGVHPGLSLTLEAAATFERIRFMRCTGCGITATTSVSGQMLTCDGCAFARNGFAATASRNGLGISFKGYEYWGVYYGDAALTDCTFEDLTVSNNVTTATTCTGAGFYSSGMGTLTMTRCRFLRNGVAAEDIEGESKAAVKWAALYLKIGSVKADGCMFHGNRTRGAGGIVGLEKGTHVFRNCAFAGNEEYGASAGSAGVLHVKSSVTIDSCTFGCNATDSAALYLDSGANVVTHSVFGGNFSPSGSEGADVRVASGASLTSDWSLYSATNGLAGADGAIANGEHTIWGDAKFVTSARQLAALRHPTAFGFDHSKAVALAAISVHLRGGKYVDELTGEIESSGGRSPAVDAGDPERDYSNEPKPNGRRVNLGAYGNTPYATTAPGGTILFVR